MAKHRIHPDRCAPDCDDQLPLLSRVGRGIEGDSYKVEISSDSNCETILEGSTFDAATKEWSSEWFSENINGGCLSYQYKLRPGTVPATFTITFIYRRPGRPEWSWTTPAIPYIWTVDEDGNKNPGDPDTMVGSGVATVYLKKTTESAWKDMLVYPDGTTAKDFNTPAAKKPWTVNISFGIGGDIEVPNIDDLAKILGITVSDIKKLIAGNTITINGVQASNIVDYIDKQDDKHLEAAKDYTDNLSSHIHTDMGFNSPGHGSNAFGGYATVKAYIDAKDGTAATNLNAFKTYVNNALKDILAKFYLGGTIGEDGHIKWPTTDKAAIGNMNVYGGGTANYIKTDADGENDVQVN